MSPLSGGRGWVSIEALSGLRFTGLSTTTFGVITGTGAGSTFAGRGRGGDSQSHRIKHSRRRMIVAPIVRRTRRLFRSRRTAGS